MAQLEGEYPSVQRIQTGLYSLDLALSSPCNELGMPARLLYELYGPPGAGKSSLAYYLLGKARPNGQVGICDLEGMDRDYLLSSLNQAHFDGVGKIIPMTDAKGKPRMHEAMLQETIEMLLKASTSAVLWDSVGATVPVSQAEGELGEAIIGRRAKLVGDTAVRAINYLRISLSEQVVLVVNHMHSIIGGRGHLTAGGERLKYLAGVRMVIYPHEVITDSNKEPLAFVAQGTIEKLRYGKRGRKFKFAILPGIGVSPELSALIDATDLGIVKRESTVKLKGTSLGYISKLIADLLEGRTQKFDPILAALDEYKEKEYGVLSMADRREPEWEETDGTE